MAQEAKRVVITGGDGYFGRQLVKKLCRNLQVERIVVMDTSFNSKKRLYDFKVNFPDRRIVSIATDVRDRKTISECLHLYSIDTVYHMAWILNPIHDIQLECDVNINGSRAIVECAMEQGVRSFIHVSSTTAVIDAKNSEELISEDREPSGTPYYPYSYLKAVIDIYCQVQMENFENFTILRPSIVLGGKTDNIVKKMASLPIMPRVMGYDPPMQFCSETDIVEVLYRSLYSRGHNIFNVAGDGTLRYSEVARILGKRTIALPESILYPVTDLAWRFHLSPFPNGVLELIKLPWVTDITRLKNVFGYTPTISSLGALQEFADSRT